MLRVRPLIGAVLTAVLVMAGVLLIDHREGLRHRDASITAWLVNAGSLLESAMTAHLQIVYSLQALVMTGRELGEAEFQSFAESLERNNSAIRNVSLQPNAVIRFISRRSDSDQLIGHDLLADPERREAVLRIIRTKKLEVIGPVPLITGQNGIVARLPIFVPAPDGAGDRFWGLATVVIDAEILLREAELFHDTPGFQVGVRGNTNAGNAGMLMGEAALFQNSSFSRPINLPAGNWSIVAAPTAGWPIPWPGRENLWLIGIPLAAALGLFIFALLRWPEQLRQGIADATTELRRLNECLKVSEEHYRALYERTPEMMHSLCEDGHINSVSDRWLEKLGYTRKEAINRHITEFLTPESAHYAREVSLPNLWRNGSNTAVPLSFVAKNGEVMEGELSSILDPSPTSDSVRTLAVVTDVTERNQAQRLLAQKNKELESANEGLRQFALVASHDIQEPLRKIGIFSSILQQEVRKSLSADGEHALSGIIRSARRLSALVSDMLKYSRSGNTEHMPQSTDLRQIVDHVINDLAVQIEEARAEIHISPLPVVMADPAQTSHLFQNLISNALKYRSPERPCRIAIDAAFQHDPERWTISIKDNGIGFSQVHAHHIWQPFHRLHSQTEYDGSGIGLAICAKIAERHHWQIQASAEPGKGATFKIGIPVGNDISVAA